MKKTLKQLTAALLAVLVSASAPVQAQNPAEIIVLFAYNLNATTETYCSLGVEQNVTQGRVASAASTSFTAASGTPYLNVAVGDYIYGNDSSAGGSERYDRNVVVRSSSTAITASNAVSLTNWPSQTLATLTDANIFLRKVTCATTNDAGAFDVNLADKVNIEFGIKQINVTGGIDVRLQCRVTPGSPWIQVLPALTAPALGPTFLNYTTTAQLAISTQDTYRQCRIGMKIGTNDDGNDLGTNSEQIYIFLRTRT